MDLSSPCIPLTLCSLQCKGAYFQILEDTALLYDHLIHGAYSIHARRSTSRSNERLMLFALLSSSSSPDAFTNRNSLIQYSLLSPLDCVCIRSFCPPFWCLASWMEGNSFLSMGNIFHHLIFKSLSYTFHDICPFDASLFLKAFERDSIASLSEKACMFLQKNSKYVWCLMTNRVISFQFRSLLAKATREHTDTHFLSYYWNFFPNNSNDKIHASIFLSSTGNITFLDVPWIRCYVIWIWNNNHFLGKQIVVGNDFGYHLIRPQRESFSHDFWRLLSKSVFISLPVYTVNSLLRFMPSTELNVSNCVEETEKVKNAFLTTNMPRADSCSFTNNSHNQEYNHVNIW